MEYPRRSKKDFETLKMHTKAREPFVEVPRKMEALVIGFFMGPLFRDPLIISLCCLI